MSTIKDESARKRSRTTFLTKDDLRLQVGKHVDKRARAEQLLQKSEENLQKIIKENFRLQIQYQKCEEEKSQLLKINEILALEIKNILGKHEKEIQEKNVKYQAQIKKYTVECQDKIDAEKIKSDIEKAKWLGEMHKQMSEIECIKSAPPTTSISTQTDFVSTTVNRKSTITKENTPEVPSISFDASSNSSSFPIFENEAFLPSINTEIQCNFQEQIKKSCIQFRNDFKKLPNLVQETMKSEADRLVSLIQKGIIIPQQNWFMCLLITDCLKSGSYNNIEQ